MDCLIIVIPTEERHPVLDTRPESSGLNRQFRCENETSVGVWTSVFAGVPELEFHMRQP